MSRTAIREYVDPTQQKWLCLIGSTTGNNCSGVFPKWSLLMFLCSRRQHPSLGHDVSQADPSTISRRYHQLASLATGSWIQQYLLHRRHRLRFPLGRCDPFSSCSSERCTSSWLSSSRIVHRDQPERNPKSSEREAIAQRY